MQYRRAGIGKDREFRPLFSLFAGDFDRSLLEVEPLSESGTRCKRIGRQADPDFTQFQQAARFTPRIGPGEVEQQVARRFHPQVDSQFAVAQRHGPRSIGGGRAPHHIVVADGLGLRKTGESEDQVQEKKIKNNRPDIHRKSGLKINGVKNYIGACRV